MSIRYDTVMNSGFMIIWLLVSAILLITFISIYFYTLRCKEPMNFWSGQSFDSNEIIDITAYNHSLSKIYLSWILFALLFTISPFISKSAPIIIAVVGMVLLLIVSSMAYKFIYKKYSNPSFVKTISEDDRKMQRDILIAALTIILVVLAIVAILMLAVGNVNATIENDDLEVRSTVLNTSISLGDISSIELRDGLDTGKKYGGLDNYKIRSGQYLNEEFGKYRMASYKDVKTYIIVHYDLDNILVFNLKSSEDTNLFYQDLLVLSNQHMS